jgi:methyltransferase
MKSLDAYLILVAAVASERLIELWLSRGNGRRAFARGGLEYGRTHYCVMVAFHTAFLAACIAETLLFRRNFPGMIGWISVGALICAEVLRYSAIWSLGERWNTRIIVIPGEPVVTGGVYRLLRHPNYVAVAVELAALPMVRGCWMTAVVFSLGNLALMAIRIPAEEAALGDSYRQAFAGLPRFLPKADRVLRGVRRTSPARAN